MDADPSRRLPEDLTLPWRRSKDAAWSSHPLPTGKTHYSKAHAIRIAILSDAQ